MAQTTYFLEHGAGDISGCPGTDQELPTSVHAVIHTLTLGTSEPVGTNWNEDLFGGQTRSGDWDCQLTLNVASGGGAPNRVTVKVERVNSSCTPQETIFEEETPTLTKSATTQYECTGVASKTVVFSSGEGVMITVWRSNGTQIVGLKYGSTPNNDSNITVPNIATPTPTPTATPTPTPTPEPVSGNTFFIGQ